MVNECEKCGEYTELEENEYGEYVCEDCKDDD